MENVSSINALRLLQAADEFRSRLAGEFSAVHGISVNEFVLLMHLDNATSKRLSRVELAGRMHVSASTVTRMVAPMEKIGMVAREVDPRDARIAFVAITEAGQTRLDEARPTFAKQAGYAFRDRWEEGELQQLSELLGRLIPPAAADLS
ncbi:transcriptional regulator, MarR family protein [Actibacterium mucosum KCTC 23349]|uniref:Transcriptional regulator, MarR family protein n=1 Tax=Actibacterium mucosum KCTC 23349 TaxID=1454373 RepID=A0A037ZEG0_9RHOB|nr:MarR family transcriptional regulator [Actibacterium mucosum]KAJ54865.1 transcriptional regulator, MarR family protein [Actibacterium mucosum KCTC 23349]